MRKAILITALIFTTLAAILVFTKAELWIWAMFVMITLNIIFALVATPFVLYKFSEKNFLFTKLGSGEIKYIMRGELLHHMIHDVRGKKWEKGVNNTENAKLIPIPDGEKAEQKKWWEEKFGLYWIGLPPAAKVLNFVIKKTRENTAGQKPEEWIDQIEKEPIEAFRQTFPMPFVFKQIELADRTKVDLLVVGTFEVIKPYIPAIQLKGDYYTRMHSRVMAATADVVGKIENLKKFIASNKKEQDGILHDPLLDENCIFQKELLKNTGLKLTEIAISNYDAEKGMEEAARKEAIAEREAAAVEATAKGLARKIEIEAEAMAKQIEKLGEAKAKAKTAQISATVNALSLGGKAEPNIVTQVAGSLLGKEAIGGPDSKVTTWVEGGSNTGVVISGDKK